MDDIDLVIRGGTVVDGSGDEPFEADVAIHDGRIVAVGQVAQAGREEIDARGRLVTPGFVDIHTHYDGQATWENRMAPSSDHGVTTVVMGNCGVGFAPCRPADRDKLVALMEGVEDIPGIVMTEGLPWNWETFPEYLDALSERRLDVDVAAQLPHSPLRVYVMGQRGVNREPSTEADRAKMRALTAEAIRAGALGVTSSRSLGHRSRSGELAPSVESDVSELLALAGGLKDAGSGVFQLIPEIKAADLTAEFPIIERIAREADRPVSFTFLVPNRSPEVADPTFRRLEAARAAGLTIRGQVYPRPVGVLFGLDLSFHPFALKPSYRAIAGLPLAEKVTAMRDPEMRHRLITEELVDSNPVMVQLCGNIADLFLLGDPPQYSPAQEASVAAIAARRGVSLEDAAYDLLLEDDGHAILYWPGANFVDGKLDMVRRLVTHPDTILGLGDGGAHYGMVCDSSYPTFVLAYWARGGTAGSEYGLPWAVRALTHENAVALGLEDRGLIAPGYKADVNVIDYDRLMLHAPRVKCDLPGGGKRLSQKASGYDATIVSGQITYREGIATGALPGRLVRGAHSAPARAEAS